MIYLLAHHTQIHTQQGGILNQLVVAILILLALTVLVVYKNLKD